jgi:hypothetical protein
MEEMINEYRILVGKTFGEKFLGRPRMLSEDNNR